MQISSQEARKKSDFFIGYRLSFYTEMYNSTLLSILVKVLHRMAPRKMLNNVKRFSIYFQITLQEFS